MYVAEVAFAIEYFLAPLSREAEGLGEWTEKFDDLGDVVIVFAVFRAGLWIEQVVASDEFKDLQFVSWLNLNFIFKFYALSFSGFVSIFSLCSLLMVKERGRGRIWNEHTIAAMLHMSVLAPHFAPRITSGERYCRVWMSFVKWCPTQQALPRSAILTDMMSMPTSSVKHICSIVELLSSEMPETSRSSRSLKPRLVSQRSIENFPGKIEDAYVVFSRCFCFSSSVMSASLIPSRSFIERNEPVGVDATETVSTFHNDDFF